MATAVTHSVYGNFVNQLETAEERLLLLDYDGTLAPFTADRFNARPYDGVFDLLLEIGSRCKTRIVIITGRNACEIPRLLPLPNLEIWGVYGLERLHPDGREEIGFLPAAGLRAISDAHSWLEDVGLGGRTDYKIGAVAVHWRGLKTSRIEEIRTECHSKLAQLACASNLTLCEFDGGLELQLRGCDKGVAVRTLLAEVGEDVPVAFLGDDASDESAFQSVNGRGLTALVRPTPRTTAASLWFKPPQQLLQFLRDWVSACEGAQ